MKTNKNPLSSDFLSKRESVKEKLELINEELDDRVDYIAKRICVVLQCKRCKSNMHSDWSYCSNYFDESIDANFVKIMRECNCLYNKDKSTILLNNGDEFDLTYRFPKRWLTEDFEEELKNGRAKYIQKTNEEKNEKESKEKELFLKIQNKLTPDELKFFLSKAKNE